jgi:hypothetical protein
MAYTKLLRGTCGVLAAAALFASAGCGTGDDGDSARGERARPSATPGPGGSGTPSAPAPPGTGTKAAPSPSPSVIDGTRDFDPDPARLPKTRAQARELALAVMAEPGLWGRDYVAQTPHLSAPDFWPVLDERCVWQKGKPPQSVLFSITSYVELPTQGDKGPVRAAATVTVHRDTAGAEWEMAATLEEALRCPAQELRPGERVSGLISLGNAFGPVNRTADDVVNEFGLYHNDAFGPKPYRYDWHASRLGQVIITVVTKAAAGRGEADLANAKALASQYMLSRIEERLEAPR